jgi:hypothetical protein
MTSLSTQLFADLSIRGEGNMKSKVLEIDDYLEDGSSSKPRPDISVASQARQRILVALLSGFMGAQRSLMILLTCRSPRSRAARISDASTPRK